MAATIDLNADVGESLGPWPMGADAALIPLVTSVNIACGFHAGDPAGIRAAIRLALASGASVGAHPGYPDLVGFGRRAMAMTPDDLGAAMLYQVAALSGMTRAEGGVLRHVKAHGALYHRVAADDAAALAFATAVAAVDASLVVVGPPGAAVLRAAAGLGLGTLVEGFADRVYEADGRLRSRDLRGSLHEDPSMAAAQAVSIARDGRVTAADGASVAIAAGTLCIHGDTPGAPVIAAAVRQALEQAGIEVRAPDAR